MSDLPAPPSLPPRARNAAPRAIVLTSHPPPAGQVVPLRWGAIDPAQRGPVIATLHNPDVRNVIGTHSGAYSLYRALAIAAGQLAPDHRPDLTDTAPAECIGPFPQWGEPDRIVSLDPWGHVAGELFADRIAAGWDIRPTIAVTRARINLPEIAHAVRSGRLTPDGTVLTAAAEVQVTKIAIEPVWHLPGVAR